MLGCTIHPRKEVRPKFEEAKLMFIHLYLLHSNQINANGVPVKGIYSD